MDLTLPYEFTPRDYQLPLFEALDSGVTRAVCTWHRRSGKDKCLINLCTKKMLERKGSYYYFFPEFNQGRRILWDGIDGSGFKFTDHIPEALRAATNAQEMKITLKNGSIFQVVGTDNYHAIRGTNPVGCVFSEYSLQNPMAWDVVKPILNENGGWAVFNFTPLGKNHGWQLYEAARNNPHWFCELLTVDDTKRPDGTPVISKQMIDEERMMGMSEDLIQQEYYCSFDASIRGAYYSEQIKLARSQGRVAPLEFDPDLPVHTSWDLGRNDENSIWFCQTYGRMFRWIHFDQRNGEGIKFYVRLLYDLHKEKGFTYGCHYLPHDISVTDYSADQSRLNIFIDTYRSLFGKDPEYRKVDAATTDPKGNIDRIEATRFLFSRFQFDDASPEVRRGLDYLSQYRKEWDEDNRVFRTSPVHDFTSHCADAFGTLPLGFEDTAVQVKQHFNRLTVPRDPFEI